MRSTAPIITCDHEDGCDQWEIDWYEATASNWRSLMEGWQYDPYRYDELTRPAFCPDHARPEGDDSSAREGITAR